MANTTTISLAVTSRNWVLAIDGTTIANVIMSTDLASSQIAYAVATALPAANSDNYDTIQKHETKTFTLQATDKVYVKKLRPRDAKMRATVTSR